MLWSTFVVHAPPPPRNQALTADKRAPDRAIDSLPDQADIEKPTVEIPIPSRSRIATIRRNLLAWYDSHKRDLPWRVDTDPYRVWISEIMLQQTRVDQAAPYFERFMSAFPTIEALARSDLDTVLKKWEGLGYYSRARNLHATASLVCEAHGGSLPKNLTELQRLPGIGAYTSGAIASIAFGIPVPAVDGNVARVLSRLFELDLDIKEPSSRRRLEPLATKLVDRRRPGDLNQSIMELGATCCVPVDPQCQSCPLSRSCSAYRRGTTAKYPRKVRRRSTPTVEQLAVIAIGESGRIAMTKRPSPGLLAGLWEFPTVDKAAVAGDNNGQQSRACVSDAMAVIGLPAATSRTDEPLSLGTVRHAYSHFKITVDVVLVKCREENQRVQAGRGSGRGRTKITWYEIDEIEDLAKTGVTKRIVSLLEGANPMIPKTDAA